MTQTSAPPRWDMTVVYPSLSSTEFEAEFRRITTAIEDLTALFGTHGIDRCEPMQVDDALVATFETVLARFNRVVEDTRTLGTYISTFVATDSRNTLAQAKRSELEPHGVRLGQLDTCLTAWIGSLDVEALIARSTVAREHAFPLRRASEQATHLMSPAEERLAAELGMTGGGAWGRLHGNVTSQLLVPIELADERKELPMSVIRTLAHDPNRDVRRRAYEAEIAGWASVALPMASALNSIKGEVNTLSRRRGWPTALDEALFDNNIDRQTLDAMMAAAHDSFPDFRRYLRAKAKLLGVPALTWYDLFAPVGESKRVWEFDQAAAYIAEQFGRYSPQLRAFAERSYRERWIDAEPRLGKRDGAFCTWLRRDESRVFMNHKSNFDSMLTLAHELGHAYHNLNLADRTILQRATPMTLAETASIFCETIVQEAALGQADRAEQILILEAALQSHCQVVVDITSRFFFEQRVFDQRRQRELAVSELNDLMLEGQRRTYGDGLDRNALHPYMWAMKPHYYRSGLSFYNFPYMFGLLFGLGLYAQYHEAPDAFRARYDDLLASTGLADAATLAQGFGIDIRTRAFWESSFDVIRRDIDTFIALVG